MTTQTQTSGSYSDLRTTQRIPVETTAQCAALWQAQQELSCASWEGPGLVQAGPVASAWARLDAEVVRLRTALQGVSERGLRALRSVEVR